MAGTRSTNTFAEGLRRILVDTADLKVTPDADLDFIYQLETMVVQKIREPQDQLAQLQAQQAGQGGMPSAQQMPDPMTLAMAGGMGGGGDPMAAMGMDPMAGGMPPAMPPGPPPGGLRMNAGAGAADELRRVLSQ